MYIPVLNQSDHSICYSYDLTLVLFMSDFKPAITQSCQLYLYLLTLLREAFVIKAKPGVTRVGVKVQEFLS